MISDIQRELGRLAGETKEINERVGRIDAKLDKHIEDENEQLSKIERQLSLGRFLWMTVKATGLTIAFALAFKFGDIAGLWKELK